MLSMIIQKELRGLLLSPKFVGTFVICTLLLLLSVSIGIIEYNKSVNQYDTALSLNKSRMERQSSWNNLSEKIYREPNRMSIFVSGLNYDIGRWTNISSHSSVKLEHSSYSDDPIFAIFRIVDFAFIVQVVLSLFAILFTYDAINGEREKGTLRLVFANAVPRATYIVGKIIGSALGLLVPILVAIFASLLLVRLFGIPFTTTEWGSLASLIGLSVLYILLFVVVGVLISSLTRRSSVSFLLSLVLWVGFVLVIPRAGVMAAGSLVNVPSLAEIEGVRDGYAKDRWNKFYKESEERWISHEEQYRDEDVDEDERDMLMWARMKEEDSLRRIVQLDIEAYEQRIKEDWQNRKQEQQQLGFALSRISPASAYKLAALNLAGSDIGLKTRYESALVEHRSKFNEYGQQKQEESGQTGGIMIEFNSDSGLKVGSSRDDAGLDLSDKPEFEYPKPDGAEIASAVVIDFGLLSVLTLLGFAAAFVSFIRYDVR